MKLLLIDVLVITLAILDPKRVMVDFAFTICNAHGDLRQSIVFPSFFTAHEHDLL